MVPGFPTKSHSPNTGLFGADSWQPKIAIELMARIVKILLIIVPVLSGANISFALSLATVIKSTFVIR